MTKYEVVTAMHEDLEKCKDRLEERLEERLREGCLLQGGVSVSVTNYSDYEDRTFVLAQAVTREDSD